MKRFRKLNMCLLVALVLCLTVGVAAAGAKTKITWSTWLGGDQLEVLKSRFEVFEKQNPDIEVEILSFAGQAYVDKLALMMASGNLPDVIHTVIYDAPRFIKEGYFRDITNLVERSGFDRDDYVPFSGIYERDGRVMGGFETHLQVYPFFYNRDTLAAAGVEDLNQIYADGGWDWDRMLQLGKKLTEDTDGDGVPDRWGLAIPGNWEAGWGNFLALAHTAYMNEDYTSVTINNPIAVEVFGFLSDLYNTHQVATMDANPAHINNGVAGMVLGGSWTMNWFQQFGSDVNWDIVPPPRYKNLQPVYYRAPGADGLITSQSKHPEEAWKLVSFMLGPCSQLDKARSKLTVPVLWDALKSDVYMISPPEHMSIILDMLNSSKPQPVFMGATQVRQAIELAVLRALQGQEAVSNALRKAQHEGTVALEEALQ